MSKPIHHSVEVTNTTNSWSKKAFNKNGDIILEEYGEAGFGGFKKEYFYDDNNKINHVDRNHNYVSSHDELYFIDKYEHDGDDYRIITYLVKRVDEKNWNPYDEVVGKLKWVDENKITEIWEYKFNKQFPKSIKHIDISNSETKLTEFEYKEGKIVYQGNFRNNELSNSTEYEYLGELLIREKRISESNILEVEYNYKNQRLVEINEFLNGAKDQLTKQSLFTYFDQEKIEIREDFEWIGGKRFIVSKLENLKLERKTIYQGRDIWSYLLNGLEGGQEIDFTLLPEISETHFSSNENSTMQISIHNQNGELIELSYVNPENPSDTFSKYFYEFEYNVQGRLEYKICYTLDTKYLKLIKDSITKYYYLD